MVPSLNLGKIIGIEIELHWTFLLLLFLVTISGGAEAFITITILFTSVVLHELSHSYIAKKNGVDVKKITLFPIGGMAVIDDFAVPGDVELKLAAAGPLFNFAVVLLVYILQLLINEPQINSILSIVFETNMILGTFNLLPAIPMDGGRIWRSIRQRKVNYLDATRDAVKLSHFVVLVLLLISFYLALAYETFGFFVWNMIIGFFVYFGSEMELNVATIKVASENLYVKNAMEPVHAGISPNSNLQDAFSLMNSEKTINLVVLGRPLKLLTHANLASVKKENWGKVKVKDVAQQCPLVSPDEKIIDAWKKMRYSNVQMLPVVYKNRTVGTISESEIEYLIILHRLLL
jgi:Zn-dependent protease